VTILHYIYKAEYLVTDVKIHLEQNRKASASNYKLHWHCSRWYKLKFSKNTHWLI